MAVADGMPVDFDERVFRVTGASDGTFVSAHVTRVGENFLETIGALRRGPDDHGATLAMAAPIAVTPSRSPGSCSAQRRWVNR